MAAPERIDFVLRGLRTAMNSPGNTGAQRIEAAQALLAMWAQNYLTEAEEEDVKMEVKRFLDSVINAEGPFSIAAARTAIDWRLL